MKNLEIALFALILSVLLSGCTHNTLEAGTGTETPMETQQIPENSVVHAEVTPDEASSTATPELKPTPQPTSTPAPRISAPTPTSTPTATLIPTPVPTPEEVTYTYSVCAESGAVITSQDSATGKFVYKKKCEVCGHVENGDSLIFVSGGSGMTSSFTCSKCGNHQKIVIGWSCVSN